MNNKMTSVFGKPIGRRMILAGGAAALAVPFFGRASWADAKPFRISTPGSPEEWQSKALEVFKKELEAAAPGQFDVQIHYNGTLFAQGTEIERRAAFRQAFAALENRIKIFLSLPLGSLDKMTLQTRLDAIGRKPPAASAA